MRFDQLRRREFIRLLGSVASMWPFAAQAQQSEMPVIGFLDAGSPGSVTAQRMAILHQSLAEAGYNAGRNVAIEYRYAEGEYSRLPAMAAELVRRRVSVLVALTTPPSLAAQAATATIPIVFTVPDDPVKLGLVASLARPGGNATGVSFLFSDLGPKQLGLLHELVPAATHIGLLVNPNNANVASVTSDVKVAAAALGIQIALVQASDRPAIETAFATLVRDKVDGLLVGTDPFFASRRLQLTTLATRHAIPAVYNGRDYAETGGLMSYGTSLTEVYRQVGVYIGRILKGTKPAELPVVQPTKFDLVINLITAKALGLDVPPMLLARADDVIE
jgi:putative ABC transport system substrate-binding protein